MKSLNEWHLLTEDEKFDVLELPYGWMLRNLLTFGNTLIPDAAIKRSSEKMIKAALEQDLKDLGFEAEIDIKAFGLFESKQIDYIAKAKFLKTDKGEHKEE